MTIIKTVTYISLALFLGVFLCLFGRAFSPVPNNLISKALSVAGK